MPNRPTTETAVDAVESLAGKLSLQPQLFVVLHCDLPSAGGSRHSLVGVDEVLIARGRERSATRQTDGSHNRLTLEIPGRAVSAAHARIRREGSDWVLEDAKSKNGTWVDGQKIERCVLRERELIEVGNTLLLFRSAVPTQAEIAQDWDSARDADEIPGLRTLIPELVRRHAGLAKVAGSTVPVALVGETGTGKEVLARAIHRLSKRPGPFVATNCGALTQNLVESQLFGHVRGAFSGAVRDEPGLVRAADRGTLLLDEVADLPPAGQAALLRVLQEREVVPLGSTRAHKVDLRIVTTSQAPLVELAAGGRFRNDLRARLEGYTSSLPPLRERLEDMGLLVAELLERHFPSGGLELRPEVGRILLGYDWPLNIRELEQCLHSSGALAQRGAISRDHLPAPLTAVSVPQRPSASGGTAPPRKRVEKDADLRRALLVELGKHDGRVADVARALGKDRKQIYRWIERLGIDLDPVRKRG